MIKTRLNLFVTVIAFSFVCVCQAQETVGAPYNPDSNADSLINVPDILSIIPLFGQEFLPSEDDLDSTNEIQSLYISNDTLYLVPNGGYVLLSDLGISGGDDSGGPGDGDVTILDSAYDLLPDICYQYVWTDVEWSDAVPSGIKRVLGFYSNAVYYLTYNGHLMKVEGANQVSTVSTNPFAGLMDLNSTTWTSNTFWTDIVDGRFLSIFQNDIIAFDLESEAIELVLEDMFPYFGGADILDYSQGVGHDLVWYGSGWLLFYYDGLRFVELETGQFDNISLAMNEYGTLKAISEDGKVVFSEVLNGIVTLSILDLWTQELEQVDITPTLIADPQGDHVDVIINEKLYLAIMEDTPRLIEVVEVDPDNFFTVESISQVVLYPKDVSSQVWQVFPNFVYKINEGEQSWHLTTSASSALDLAAVSINNEIYAVDGEQTEWLFEPANQILSSKCLPKLPGRLAWSMGGLYAGNVITGEGLYGQLEGPPSGIINQNNFPISFPPSVMALLGAKSAWIIPVE